MYIPGNEVAGESQATTVVAAMTLSKKQAVATAAIGHKNNTIKKYDLQMPV